MIISSPTGAAVQDFIQIVTRRAPFLDVILIPTLVQGEGSAAKIMDALRASWKIPGVDVVVLARGGGSIEDLWAFNDERLARLISQSPVPTISAVGHEIDFTIADFVSDLRAPTPSAAAELVAKSSKELNQRLTHLSHILHVSLDRKIKNFLSRLENLTLRLVDPQKKLQDLSLRNDELLSRLQSGIEDLFLRQRHKIELLSQRMPHPKEKLESNRIMVTHLLKNLDRMIKRKLENSRLKLEHKMAVMDSISRLKVLDRGYAIVTQNEKVIRSPEDIDAQQALTIRMSGGTASIKINEIRKG